jgi:MFS superfamily sulfate permease-like transporter
LLLLGSLLFFPNLLNLIPLASLSAILIITGYKLTKPSVYLEMKRRGWHQFIPFLVTIIAILETDLLKGVFIGMVTGFVFGLRSNFINAVIIMKDADRLVIRFGKEVSFLNEGVVKNSLRHVQDHMRVIIDATRSEFIDRDIVETVNDFIKKARQRGIIVNIRRSLNSHQKYFSDQD